MWSSLAQRRKSVDDTDEVLIVRVRDGDRNAYGELYRRHHRAAASTARWMTGSRSDVDDIVAEAFASVLAAIDRGSGPHDNFRHYLLACVRNGSRRRHRAVPVGPDDPVLGASPVTGAVALEDPERYVTADTVARAFADLPVRWQRVLWATAVEQKTSEELCAEFDVSPNAAAALTYRAREAFAAAYLGAHATVQHEQACRAVGPQLARFVRGALPDAAAHGVRAHLDGCATCRRAADELGDINTSLRSLLPAPAVVQLMESSRRAAAPFTAGGGATISGTVIASVAAAAVCVIAVLLVGINRFGGIDGAPEPRVVVEGSLPVAPDSVVPEVPATEPPEAPPAVGAPLADPDAPPLDDVDEADRSADAGDAPATVALDGDAPPREAPDPAGPIASPGAGPGGGGAAPGGAGSGPEAPEPDGSPGAGATTVPGDGVGAGDDPDRLLAWLGVDDAARPLGAEPLVAELDEVIWEVTSAAVAPTVGGVWIAATDLLDVVPAPLPVESLAAPLLQLLGSIPGAPLVALPDAAAPASTVADAEPSPTAPSLDDPAAPVEEPAAVPEVDVADEADATGWFDPHDAADGPGDVDGSAGVGEDDDVTSVPTTSVPVTSAPVTSVPTTSVPVTSVPTTSAPTTSAPATTSAPTTSVPTTSAPTTSVPAAGETAVPTAGEVWAATTDLLDLVPVPLVQMLGPVPGAPLVVLPGDTGSVPAAGTNPPTGAAATPLTDVLVPASGAPGAPPVTTASAPGAPPVAPTVPPAASAPTVPPPTAAPAPPATTPPATAPPVTAPPPTAPPATSPPPTAPPATSPPPTVPPTTSPPSSGLCLLGLICLG